MGLSDWLRYVYAGMMYAAGGSTTPYGVLQSVSVPLTSNINQGLAYTLGDEGPRWRDTPHSVLSPEFEDAAAQAHQNRFHRRTGQGFHQDPNNSEWLGGFRVPAMYVRDNSANFTPEHPAPGNYVPTIGQMQGRSGSDIAASFPVMASVDEAALDAMGRMSDDEIMSVGTDFMNMAREVGALASELTGPGILGALGVQARQSGVMNGPAHPSGTSEDDNGSVHMPGPLTSVPDDRRDGEDMAFASAMYDVAVGDALATRQPFHHDEDIRSEVDEGSLFTYGRPVYKMDLDPDRQPFIKLSDVRVGGPSPVSLGSWVYSSLSRAKSFMGSFARTSYGKLMSGEIQDDMQNAMRETLRLTGRVVTDAKRVKTIVSQVTELYHHVSNIAQVMGGTIGMMRENGIDVPHAMELARQSVDEFQAVRGEVGGIARNVREVGESISDTFNSVVPRSGWRNPNAPAVRGPRFGNIGSAISSLASQFEFDQEVVRNVLDDVAEMRNMFSSAAAPAVAPL